MIIIAWIAVTVICFFIAAYFRLKIKKYGSDEYYHLMVAEQIKKNKFRLFKEYPWVLTPKNEKPEEFDYPPLFLYILALIPKKILIKYRRFISPLFTSITCLFLMIFVFLISQNFNASIIAGILFCITPATFHQTYNLNPRTLANLLFSITIVAMWLFLKTPSIEYFFITVFCFCLVILTHKLATQALVLTFIALAIFYANIYFILIIIGGIILSILLSKGFYFKVLKGHIAIVKFWSRHLTKFTVGKIYGKDLRHRTIDFATKIGLNLWLVFVPILIYNTTKELQFFIYIPIALFIVTVLTATKMFGGLGDYAKYYDYGIFSLMIPLSIYIARGELSVLIITGVIIIVNGLIINYIFKKAFVYSKSSLESKEFLKMVQWLKKRKETNMLFIPSTNKARAVRFYLNKKFPNLESATKAEQRIIKDEIYLHVSKRKLKKNIKKYNIEMILIENPLLKDYNLSFCKKVYSNKEYSVFAIIKKR